MSSIDLSQRGLTELPLIESEVRRLRCSRNQISSLRGLPDTRIEDPGVSYNHLTSLTGCPSTLRNIVVVNNFLSHLDGLQSCVLVKCYCSYNQITTLEHLRHVEILDASCNLLSSLRTCPEGVQELIVSNNRLESLEGCPPSVKILRCADKSLTNLDGLPPGLEVLDCSKNDRLPQSEIDRARTWVKEVFGWEFCLGDRPSNFRLFIGLKTIAVAYYGNNFFGLNGHANCGAC